MTFQEAVTKNCADSKRGTRFLITICAIIGVPMLILALFALLVLRRPLGAIVPALVAALALGIVGKVYAKQRRAADPKAILEEQLKPLGEPQSVLRQIEKLPKAKIYTPLGEDYEFQLRYDRHMIAFTDNTALCRVARTDSLKSVLIRQLANESRGEFWYVMELEGFADVRIDTVFEGNKLIEQLKATCPSLVVKPFATH